MDRSIVDLVKNYLSSPSISSAIVLRASAVEFFWSCGPFGNRRNLPMMGMEIQPYLENYAL